MLPYRDTEEVSERFVEEGAEETELVVEAAPSERLGGQRDKKKVLGHPGLCDAESANGRGDDLLGLVAPSQAAHGGDREPLRMVPDERGSPLERLDEGVRHSPSRRAGSGIG